MISMYLFVTREIHIVDWYSIGDHHLLGSRLGGRDYHDLGMRIACLRGICDLVCRGFSVSLERNGHFFLLLF